MKREITILCTLFMILFSTTIPGVYAMENETEMGMPQMDAAQMKEMTLEMIENNIDTLTTLQSESDDDDLSDAIDELIEQMESLKTELEDTDDEEAIMEIMDELRASMEDAPDEVREALMKNVPMAGDGQEGRMDGQGPMNGSENIAPSEADFPGNGSMDGSGPMNKQDIEDITGAGDSNDDSSQESTGLLTGLINMIKALF